jgi:hypothetical protein
MKVRRIVFLSDKKHLDDDSVEIAYSGHLTPSIILYHLVMAKTLCDLQFRNDQFIADFGLIALQESADAGIATNPNLEAAMIFASKHLALLSRSTLLADNLRYSTLQKKLQLAGRCPGEFWAGKLC